MATLATDTLNQTLTVTNPIADSIVVASVKDDLDSGLVAYAQQLTAVSAVIAPQSQGTATLNQPGQTDYSLISMRAKDLFPVANRVAVMPVECGSQPSAKCTDGVSQYYADLTVDAAEFDGMKQAFYFHQAISAFPGTDMALNFIQLLSDHRSDPKNAESAINQFFKQTKGYEKCTLQNYIAASTYCRYYAFAWANLQESFAYAVFQPASDPNANEALIDQGTIFFTKKANAPNPADIQDRNGGFDIVYQPVAGDAVPLALVDGILCSTESTTNPDVALLLTYQLKSDFTGLDTDKKAWPVLVGSANQVKVLAVGVPTATFDQTQTAARPLSVGRFPNLDDFKASAKKLFTPKTAVDGAKLAGILAGVAVGLAATAGMVYLVVREYRKYKEVKLESQDKVAAEIKREYVRTAERLSQTDIPIENDSVLESGQYDDAVYAGKEGKEYLAERVKQTYKGLVERQQEVLDTIGKHQNSPGLEEAQAGIDDIKEMIKDAKDWNSLKPKLPEIRDAVESVKINIEAAKNDVSNALSKADKEFIENTKDMTDLLEEAAAIGEKEAIEYEQEESPIEPEEVIEI